MNQVQNESAIRSLDIQVEDTSVDWCKNVLDGMVSVPLDVTVELGSASLSRGELESLGVGDFIRFRNEISDELFVYVAGVPKYKCFFGASGSNRAVQITYVYPGGEVSHTTEKSEEFQISEVQTVLDLPLEVHVEFGRTRTSLGEILQLKKGSILELSSGVEEPLTIFINGKAFATGNAVTSNGRFGVEVTEILAGVETGRERECL